MQKAFLKVKEWKEVSDNEIFSFRGKKRSRFNLTYSETLSKYSLYKFLPHYGKIKTMLNDGS
jgi:hypothetical protein